MPCGLLEWSFLLTFNGNVLVLLLNAVVVAAFVSIRSSFSSFITCASDCVSTFARDWDWDWD